MYAYDYEAAQLEFIVDVSRRSAIAIGGGHLCGELVVRAKTPIENDLDRLDAGKAGREVLKQVGAVLGDHHEDAHGPQPTSGGAPSAGQFLSADGPARRIGALRSTVLMPGFPTLASPPPGVAFPHEFAITLKAP